MSAERHLDPPLPYLETFAKVAELASFTAAAKELSLTQAAVSQRIHALEQAVGTALLERQTGKTALTEPGQRLYPFVQRIMALHQEAIAAVTGQSAPLTGDLSLAASSIPGEHLLPAMLARFRREHPGVHVRVSVTDSLAVARAVANGDAHLGLVGAQTDLPHLEFHPFASDEVVLVTPADHAWARRQRITLDRLAAEPLILREPGSGSRQCLDQALTRAGRSLSEFRIALELGSNEAIKQAVQQGLGISAMSRLAVASDLEAGRLHAVRITDVPLRRELYVVHDSRRPLGGAARAFLSLCRDDGREARSAT